MDLRTLFNNDIPSAVREWCEANVKSGKTFVSYLEAVRGEIVKRVFAARRYAKEGLLITEVIRESTDGSKTIVRNLLYSRMAGYTPVFKAKDYYYRSGGYPFLAFAKEDFNVWDYPALPLGIWNVVINPETVSTIEEFKYCGYKHGDAIEYIRKWRKDSSIEMFGKMDLCLSPSLIKMAKGDKQFRRFLWEHHSEVNDYGAQATIYAYKKHMSIEKARDVCFVKNQNDRLAAYLVPEVKGTKIDRTKLLDYLERIGDEHGNRYDDYLKAIKGLKLDLNDTKNVFPKDFNRMHDLRAAEYASNFEKIDAEKRKKLYKQFSQKAEELDKYALAGETYSIVIPHSITELIQEGDKLSHCVGKMGYDKKVVDGISLIAFVRKNGELDQPFVTAEFRLDRNALWQCYGFKDSKPDDDVLAFVNAWADGIAEGRRCK